MINLLSVPNQLNIRLEQLLMVNILEIVLQEVCFNHQTADLNVKEELGLPIPGKHALMLNVRAQVCGVLHKTTLGLSNLVAKVIKAEVMWIQLLYMMDAAK